MNERERQQQEGWDELRRRGVSLLPPPEPVAADSAPQPRQAHLNGQPLWQDAEGTVPVTHDGDPVGRVGASQSRQARSHYNLNDATLNLIVAIGRELQSETPDIADACKDVLREAYEAGAALGEPPPAAARQEAVNAIRQARQKRHDLPHDDCAFYDGGDIWAAELKGFDRAIAAVEALGEGASERDGSRNERT